MSPEGRPTHDEVVEVAQHHGGDDLDDYLEACLCHDPSLCAHPEAAYAEAVTPVPGVAA